MMTPTQNECLQALGEILSLAPELRVGQFIAFMGDLSAMENGVNLGNMEDDVMPDLLQRHRDELAARSFEPVA